MHSITLEQRLGDRVSSFQGEDVTGAVWTSLNIEISRIEISLNGLIARFLLLLLSLLIHAPLLLSTR